MNFSYDFAARLPIDSMIGQLNSTSQSAADDVKYCTISSIWTYISLFLAIYIILISAFLSFSTHIFGFLSAWNLMIQSNLWLSQDTIYMNLNISFLSDDPFTYVLTRNQQEFNNLFKRFQCWARNWSCLPSRLHPVANDCFKSNRDKSARCQWWAGKEDKKGG